MKRKIEKGSEEFQLFQDFWKFRQDFHDADSEDFFEEIVKAGDLIIAKYKKTELSNFARQLIHSCMADTEERWRNEQQTKAKK